MNRHRRAWGKCLVEQSLGSAPPSRPYSSLFRPRSQLLVFSLLQKGRVLAQDGVLYREPVVSKNTILPASAPLRSLPMKNKKKEMTEATTTPNKAALT